MKAPVNLLPSRKDNFITFKVLSRNKIKYLSALKNKKFRNIYGKYIIEGEKIVTDIIRQGNIGISELIATENWFGLNEKLSLAIVKEKYRADINDFTKISSMESPPEVLAVLDIPEYIIHMPEVTGSVSVALETIQDPGNLGTIIRSANWFGIKNIFCSEDCADCFSPKVVQASMGAVLQVKVHYVNLENLIKELLSFPAYTIYGTFISGGSVFACEPLRKGMIVFGNESRGISGGIARMIRNSITIPPVMKGNGQVESLNVAAAMAIVCATLTKE